eukprot:jgi/Hompol1/2283/HPOL_005940-RA
MASTANRFMPDTANLARPGTLTKDSSSADSSWSLDLESIQTSTVYSYSIPLQTYAGRRPCALLLHASTPA